MLDASFESTSVPSPEAGELISGRRPTPPAGVRELKFRVTDEQASGILDWSREHLRPDPHAHGAGGDHYHVSSLYLDTPTLDVYHRSPALKQRKFRWRRYGAEEVLWLEVKQKQDGRVVKQRVACAALAVEQWLKGAALPTAAAGFESQLQRYRLRPVCQVTYDRWARLGQSETGPVRLTLDAGIRAVAEEGWQVPWGPLPGKPLVAGLILELKFRDVLPTQFRRLIQQFGLTVGSLSKYRTAVESTWTGSDREVAGKLATVPASGQGARNAS